VNERALEAVTSSIRQNYGTPRSFTEWIFSFASCAVDVCAEPWNAKLNRYFTPEEDGLRQPWRNCCWWNNCQYDQVVEFLGHSKHEGMMGGAGFNLVAARPDTKWFRDATENGMGPLIRSLFVPQTRVWWCVWRDLVVGIYHHHQRLKFEVPPGTLDKKGRPMKVESAPFPSSLIIHAARAARRKVDFGPAKKLETKCGLPALTWRMPE